MIKNWTKENIVESFVFGIFDAWYRLISASL